MRHGRITKTMLRSTKNAVLCVELAALCAWWLSNEFSETHHGGGNGGGDGSRRPFEKRVYAGAVVGVRRVGIVMMLFLVVPVVRLRATVFQLRAAAAVKSRQPAKFQ